MIDYPPPSPTDSDKPTTMATRLAVAAGVGAFVGIVAAFVAPWQTIPLLAWSGTALTWVAMMAFKIVRMDAVATSTHATHEDPRRSTADALLLSASVISIGAVILGVIKAGNTHGAVKAVLLGAGILTIIVSWAVVHTVYTLRYAALYYSGADGGVSFNEDEKPCYLDFAYLALTIGMTYQVSDTNLTDKTIRHTALRHALMSYLFGTIIIAATINLAAGLAK